MFRIVLILFSFVLLAKNFYIPTVDLQNDTAEEVQNAICTISTKEIEATANATITRELKGVCTSNELNLKLDKLEMKILQEIDGIKYMLEINGFKISDTDLENISPKKNKKQLDYFDYKPESLRKNEILTYNNSIVDGNTYFYYWEIVNIQQLLVKKDMYISSPNFQVLGHNLHLQFYPNHMSTGYFGIELRPDSHSFLKRHKIGILNQLNAASDLNSGVLYAIDIDKRIYRVSERQLNTEGYTRNDTLIVKLEIFLKS